jgi:midasin
MRAVIPYIASGFKKDKIWLRRTQPDRRNYQIIVAIDDTLSMREHRSGQLGIEALLVMCKALTRLEVGQVAVVRFGTTADLVLPFERPYTADVGPELLQQFSFAQDPDKDQAGGAREAPFTELLNYSSAMFEAAARPTHAAAASAKHLQLLFVIGDGRIDRDRQNCGKLIRQAAERGQMCAMILIDTPDEASQSVFKRKNVAFPPGAGGRPVITPYLEQYPFNFYAVVQAVSSLPFVLGDALRQWFEATTEG